ncbi:MAG: RluA family pseudouridine synthase [Firmicutes bacterium]|jgi:23S rRNA pseudouridine1911/1915/1917 synthase|nr:RluA family pseudouridine synthase [Bacillota bacterium]
MDKDDLKQSGIEIPAVFAGERVDRTLSVLLGCSRSLIAEMIQEGSVLLNDRQIQAGSKKVMPGDILRIMESERPGEASLFLAEETFDLEEAKVNIVFEDRDILVVSKPAGMVVHPGAAKEKNTLIAVLLKYDPSIGSLISACGCHPSRPGVLHRLDKDTSGLVIVAKTPEAYMTLTKDIAERKVKKGYVALVSGLLDNNEGTIEAPIGRSVRSPVLRAVSLQGRDAVTEYKVLKKYPAVPATLVNINLVTGRTHQIRVHFQAIGHAVLGDKTYGSKTGTLGLNRQYLHASRLEFNHPVSGEKCVFESQPPEDLLGFIKRLDADYAAE